MWAPANSKDYYESLNMLRGKLFLGWKSGHQPLHKDYFCTNYRKQLKQNFPAYYKTFLVGWKICNFAMPWSFRQKKILHRRWHDKHTNMIRGTCVSIIFIKCVYMWMIKNTSFMQLCRKAHRKLFFVCYKQGNKIVQIFSFALKNCAFYQEPAIISWYERVRYACRYRIYVFELAQNVQNARSADHEPNNKHFHSSCSPAIARFSLTKINWMSSDIACNAIPSVRLSRS